MRKPKEQHDIRRTSREGWDCAKCGMGWYWSDSGDALPSMDAPIVLSEHEDGEDQCFPHHSLVGPDGKAKE